MCLPGLVISSCCISTKDWIACSHLRRYFTEKAKLQVMGLWETKARKCIWDEATFILPIHNAKASAPWCWIQPVSSQSQSCHPLFPAYPHVSVTSMHARQVIHGGLGDVSSCQSVTFLLSCHSVLKLNFTLSATVFEAYMVLLLSLFSLRTLSKS